MYALIHWDTLIVFYHFVAWMIAMFLFRQFTSWPGSHVKVVAGERDSFLTICFEVILNVDALAFFSTHFANLQKPPSNAMHCFERFHIIKWVSLFTFYRFQAIKYARRQPRAPPLLAGLQWALLLLASLHRTFASFIFVLTNFCFFYLCIN